MTKDWLSAARAWFSGEGMDPEVQPGFGPVFRYRGEAADWRGWAHRLEPEEPPPGGSAFRAVYVAPDGLLELHLSVRLDPEFGVVEWLPRLRNGGDAVSGVVEDFQSLALVQPLAEAPDQGRSGQRVTLRRALGSKCSYSDFLPESRVLRDRYPRNVAVLETDEGRSSSAWLPFFGLDFAADRGLIGGIGWSGAWRAEFRLESRRLLATAGMRRTHFRLSPGEELRQPSIYLLDRSGETVQAGQNRNRRFLLARHSPRDRAGKLQEVPLSFQVWGGVSSAEMLAQLKLIETQRLPYDVFWIDAGWYGPDSAPAPDVHHDDWYLHAGDWRINRGRHPEGLTPVADAAHRLGLRTLLWVEIERARRDSPVAQAHPEWFLATSDNPDNLLLNLGCPEARNWAADTVIRLFRENHLDCYRQDFNFNTIPHWENADAPDRIGVTEARYIDGLYQLWDTLRERIPDLLIDNCASGGRRIDFETMSRSLPLWRSDVQCFPGFDPIANQLECWALAPWVPLHSGGLDLSSAATWQDEYAALSALGPGIAYCLPPPEQPVPAARHRRWVELARQLRPLFRGDFLPLTTEPEDPTGWLASCYCRPEQGDGVVLAFRRPGAPAEHLTVELSGVIDPTAEYEVEDEQGTVTRQTGAELQRWTLQLPPRTAALRWFRLRGRSQSEPSS